MRRLWRAVLDQVTPYEAGPSIEELERTLAIDGLVRLSANESPLGPSAKAIAAYREVGEHLEDYPDGAASDLRDAIGAAFGLGFILGPFIGGSLASIPVEHLVHGHERHVRHRRHELRIKGLQCCSRNCRKESVA